MRFETGLGRAFCARLAALEAAAAAEIIDGQCASFDAYRAATGRLRGIRDAAEAAMDAERAYLKGDDEDGLDNP